jgi:hypothetical protein
MERSRIRALVYSALAAAWSLQGCTYGVLSDAATGDPVEHGSVMFFPWDTSMASLGGTAVLHSGKGVETWAAADPGGVAGMYVLNPYALDKLAPGDPRTLETPWV